MKMRTILIFFIIALIVVNTLTGILYEGYNPIISFINSMLMTGTLLFINAASSAKIRENYKPAIYLFLIISMVAQFFLSFHLQIGEDADLWANNTIFMLIVANFAVVLIPKYLMK